jgi:hypothetical protein
MMVIGYGYKKKEGEKSKRCTQVGKERRDR